MASRLDLQTLLENILGSDFVYFQPPSTINMFYPCIVYRRSDINIKHADNNPYVHKKEYTITVIDSDPDSIIPDAISMLSSCNFDRQYLVDNLYHDVFTLFF